jgi:uncharacterized protein YrrD
MQFKDNTMVYTSDGEEVGRIDRVVIDPHTKETTCLVVKEGLLFTEDKMVAVELIDSAMEEKVNLRKDAGDLQNLPLFEKTHYVYPKRDNVKQGHDTGTAKPVLWYPPLSSPWGALNYPVPEYMKVTEQNIPEGTVALKEGAKVLSADGKQVGKIDRIFTDRETSRITHLLISKGVFLKAQKLVPAFWIDKVDEDEVVITIDSSFVESLPDYNE